MDVAQHIFAIRKLAFGVTVGVCVLAGVVIGRCVAAGTWHVQTLHAEATCIRIVHRCS